jgi:phasin family protein
MADIVPVKPEDSAEKAFAAAVESIVTIPPLASARTQPEPVAAAKPVEVAKPAEAAKTLGNATSAVPTKPVAAKVALAKGPPAAAKPAKPVKAKAKKAASSRRPAKPAKKTTSKPHSIPQTKDKIMATKKTPDFTEGLKDFVADAQKQAKSAYAKGSVLLSEAGEFTKGNAEALVASGKIFAAGAQNLGKAYVAETKSAVEVAKADVKAIAAVRSPVDFVKLQGDILRRNTESAFAFTTKNSEAVLKLATEAFAPISGRFSLAVEKIKQAA